MYDLNDFIPAPITIEEAVICSVAAVILTLTVMLFVVSFLGGDHGNI